MREVPGLSPFVRKYGEYWIPPKSWDGFGTGKVGAVGFADVCTGIGGIGIPFAWTGEVAVVVGTDWRAVEGRAARRVDRRRVTIVTTRIFDGTIEETEDGGMIGRFSDQKTPENNRSETRIVMLNVDSTLWYHIRRENMRDEKSLLFSLSRYRVVTELYITATEPESK